MRLTAQGKLPTCADSQAPWQPLVAARPRGLVSDRGERELRILTSKET